MSSSPSPLRIVRAITLVMAVAVVVEGNTKSDCGVAQTAFGMCVPYVMGEEREVWPSCCAGVRSVKELSPSSMARRNICDCLRTMMAQVGRIDTRRAAGLAGKCRIRTNVIPTSLGFRCFEKFDHEGERSEGVLSAGQSNLENTLFKPKNVTVMGRHICHGLA